MWDKIYITLHITAKSVIYGTIEANSQCYNTPVQR